METSCRCHADCQFRLRAYACSGGKDVLNLNLPSTGKLEGALPMQMVTLHLCSAGTQRLIPDQANFYHLKAHFSALRFERKVLLM